VPHGDDLFQRYRRIGNEIHYSADECALSVPLVIPSARHVLFERTLTKIREFNFFLRTNLHRKNDFAEISKNLDRYTFENNNIIGKYIALIV